jgi:hypothetical protein
MSLWTRGPRGSSGTVGARTESISITSSLIPNSCSTRFRRAVEGGSDSAESTCEVEVSSNVVVKFMLLLLRWMKLSWQRQGEI